jgi:acyl-coenzyme A thioesterase PaaI-like protein
VALTPERSEIHVANQRRVQNHIQGVHAAAMSLLAETATGMVVGMNVRDDCLPLCKSLQVKFKKRATGALTAVAHLTDAQRASMARDAKGEVLVAVTVTDEAGIEPIECEFVWAWIPKEAKANNARKTS